MTTPEQLLADPKWRRRHSVYTLWALFLGFGFISLLYTGLRSKKSKWTTWGIVYGVLAVSTISVGGAMSPEDPDAATPLAVSITYNILMVVWVISAIHVFRERKEWLRWKASVASQPKWYESPSATTGAGADLSAIGMDDPATEFLAPPPTSVQAARPERRLPPPPVAPPARAERNLPPPPSAPPTHAASASEVNRGTTDHAVDLNVATVDTIAAIPGVGVATATRIVEERKKRGGFESVDEAAVAAGVQPHVRSRLQQLAVVSQRAQSQTRRASGRIVDI